MENQDIETKEEDQFPFIEEEINLSDSGSSLETEDLPEEMSPDSPEEFSSSPPSPIDGDIKSLPLSEEIQKQKSSQKQTKKLTLVGVVGVVLLLVLIGVFGGMNRTSIPVGDGSFSIAQKLGLIKAEAEKQRASAEIAGKNRVEKSGIGGEPRNYFRDGIAYHQKGKVNKAMKAFQLGMEKEPELKEIGYNNQGVIFAENGKYEKGIRYFKQALKINPRYADAHYNLAAAYEKSRNEQRALFHYQRFIELAEEDYSGLTMRVKQHVAKR